MKLIRTNNWYLDWASAVKQLTLVNRVFTLTPNCVVVYGLQRADKHADGNGEVHQQIDK